jgi:hypothetical protein
MPLEFESPRFQGDPLLLRILNDPDTGTLRLGPGDKGESVLRLQRALFDLNWTLRIDEPVLDESQFVIGQFGPKTWKTVLAYKTHHEIIFPGAATISGYAGPRTFQRLDRNCVHLDDAIAAIEAKAEDLRLGGAAVKLDTTPPATRTIQGLPTAYRYAVLDDREGAIYQHAALGVFAIHGPIYTEYERHGGPVSRLGSPTSDVYEANGGLRADFEHGALQLDPGTGTVAWI